MNKKLDEKVAIITGGARGLGKGIAKSLLSNGSKIVIFDSNKENGVKSEFELNKEFNSCARIDIDNLLEFYNSLK